MKRFLHLLLLLCLIGTTAIAQTSTWTGAGDGTNWSDAANWSLNAVPTASNDVIIPNGSDVNVNVSSFVKSIVVQGTSTLTMNQSLSFTDASSFSANTTVTWKNHSFYGGGTLTNNGTIIMATGGSRYISGGTTLINNGLVTMPGGGYLYLYDTSVFNNTASGVFDFQSNAIVTYGGNEAHNFINAGLLKKTAGDGNSGFSAYLTNTGTMSVENGSLIMQSLPKTFNGGVYNVATDATLVLNTTINVDNELTGTLEGAMNWNNNISVATTASFNFTGATGVTWTANSLLGGGVLTNESTIGLAGGGSRYISGGTTLINNGLVTMPGGGYLYLYDTSVFNNAASGVFDFQSNAIVSYGGNEAHNFINAGLLKKTAGGGNSGFSAYLTNTGTMSVENGSLIMQSLPKTFNGGVYNVATDATLVLNTTINVSNELTGTLEGAMNWNNNISVATTASFNFTGATGVTWTANSLLGGGALTNESTISLAGGGSRYISGGTTLTNNGLVTMPGGGYFYLYDTSVFNNTALGVFDFQSDAVVSYSGSNHSFNNAGLLKKTAGDNTSYFGCILTNTGTINVEHGSIQMYNQAKTFNGGVYNVATDATLVLNTTINVSNELTGALQGAMNWNSNISVATTANFNFTGATGVTWTGGSLLGGGTLTNESDISLAGAGSRYISGEDTKLINTGTIKFPDGGYLYLYNNAIIDNQASGVIDFQSDTILTYSGSEAFSINNAGLIQKTGGTGVSYIYPPVTNSGTINASSGELEFVDGFGLNNTVDGIIKGTATIDIPAAANFTNDGIFAPGGSPGTLTVLGAYKSSSTSVLDVELNGLTPDTEYDVLAITGNNVIFDGEVNVTMGFEGNLGNTFTIATTSSTIATENLTTPVIAVYQGKQYTFDVTYPGDNSVLLTISGKLDIEPPTVLTQNITIQLDASGNASITTAQIDNGSTDNCTLQANLLYALDVTSFTCADLGDNTVSLTVTDEAGNFASADATVTVEDSIDPTVVTQNVTVQLDASGNASITTGDIDNGSTDNCTVSSLSLDVTNFTCANLGDNTVMLTVTDQSGNSASASATVTVEDNIDPIVICRGDVVINEDTGYTVPDYYANNEISVTDNCSSFNVVQTPAPGTVINADGDTLITLTATDASGNVGSCSFNLNVTLGVEGFQLSESNITLFPNPTNNIVTLKNNSHINLTKATIIDISGRILSVVDLKGMNGTKEISLENYSSGNYFLRIESLNSSIVKQIIKK
ncbi:MAG: T9SS type A sorting domain-containing protein [Gelidibacter sp.]